ncbi:unnamed protein product [Closterium sp. Naga37s-1]|nr:unnamed protein product [Closterium sp. Naga37s-1]
MQQLYLVVSVYFSGDMVRLMLVLAPAVCITADILISALLDVLTPSVLSPLAPLLLSLSLSHFHISSFQVRLMLVLAPAACITAGIAVSALFDVLTRSVKASIAELIDLAYAAAKQDKGEKEEAAPAATEASIADLIDLAYAAAKQHKGEKEETTVAAAAEARGRERKEDMMCSMSVCEATSKTGEASQAKERKAGAGKKKKKGREGEGEGGESDEEPAGGAAGAGGKKGVKGKGKGKGAKEKEKAKGKFPLVVPGDAAAVGIILMLVGLAFYTFLLVVPGDATAVGIILMLVGLAFDTMHCVWAAADAYSAPSIVLSSPTNDGGQYIFDDFREAYGWLRHNTDVNDKVGPLPPTSVVVCVPSVALLLTSASTATNHGGQYIFDDFRGIWWDYGYQTTAMANRMVIVDNNTWNNVKLEVASWWDYGYQTTAMANRTVIVDNNTWNNTHIATVGMAMSSREKDAWAIYRSIDVKYVFVVFGGMVGYPSDDINKFLWMVRIGGGVFPRIREPDYLNNGNYRVDGEATSTMLNCLMYKLSYYRFAEVDGRGFDRVRRTEIGKKNIKLTHFEEVFTSQHWMVRIYRLKEPRNRPRGAGKRLTRVSAIHIQRERSSRVQANPSDCVSCSLVDFPACLTPMAFSRSLFRAANVVKRSQKDGSFSRLFNQAFRPLTTELHAKLQEVVPQQQERIRQIKSHYGNLSMGKVTVNMAIGGMRGVKGLVWETSQLDPEQGIKFRGYSIPECQHLLPKAVIDGEPMPEGLLWLLLTGEVPTREQAATVTHELHERAKMPEFVHTVLNALPRDMHPMTQLSIGVMALQKGSRFARAYHEGMPKSKYWHLAYEDALDLIATLPQVAAHIYRHTFKDGKIIPPNEKLDYAANFAHMLGFNDPQFHDLMRLYLTIHADHEGGNVSAHATHLVGSALSDPYLSFAAGLNGLAGPLHGLANQEVLRWLEEVEADVGEEAGKDELRDFVWRTLQSGKVVPGYGHAVLRVTDPRYSCQRQFALKHLPHDPTFKLVSNLYEVVPHILLETGKVKNPWPNVDAHSGVLLQHYGLTEASYYTVLFGVSRAMGVLSQLVWDRALGFPIERPKSITLDWIEEFASDKAHKEEQHAHEHKH